MPVYTRNRRNGAKFQAHDYVDVLYNPSNHGKGPEKGRYKGVIIKVEQIHAGEQKYIVRIFNRNVSAEVLVSEKEMKPLREHPTGGARRTKKRGMRKR